MAAPVETRTPSSADRTQIAPEPGELNETAVGRPDRIKQTFGPAAERGEIGTLGPYRIAKQLGRGGMGAVYSATDTRLGRRLALKVMLPECAADADAKERFLREARAAAQISHDNVVTVFEADERDGVPYIAMQFLQGYPLDEFLKRKGCPTVPQVLRIARETAAGLAAAHNIGLVHRDIKPANLWLEAPNGRVKVLDFGLAKPLHTEAELTQSGIVVGTPAYMSPEQARGKKVDHRSDLFSLGAVLYRLCTGQLPFDGPTTMAVLMALGTEDPVPVRERNPAVPEAVAELVHQLLAKEPDARPGSAAEVVKRVRAITESTGASQVVVTPAPRVVCPPPQPSAGAPSRAFATLGTTDAASVLPDLGPPAAPTPAPLERKKPRAGWRLAVGLAAILAVAAGGAIVTVTSKGARTRNETPSGAAGAVENKGAEPRAAGAVGNKGAEPHTPGGPQRPAGGGDRDRAAAERVLAAGGMVRVSGRPQEIRSAADLPEGRFALVSVNLSDKLITDADLAGLKDCVALTRIILHGTRVTDGALAHFKNLPELEFLSFTGTGLTDAGLAQLTRHPKLRVLHITGTQVTDAGLAHLKDLRELTELFVSDTSVSNRGLVHLKGLKKLSGLELNETQVTDAGLLSLKELPGLTELSLGGTQVTDTGLAHLKGTRLTFLDVGETAVTAKGVAAFRASAPQCAIKHNTGPKK
ncbi:MAG TPA: protein kinase [Gemmata sp.]